MTIETGQVCPITGVPRNSQSALTVLLLSGGVDSVTLLHHLRRSGSVIGLFVDYAQRAAEREHEVARFHCNALDVELEFLDLRAVAKRFIEKQVARLHVPLPHRNVVVQSLALSYASQVGAKEVATAVIADDVEGYPSSSLSFLTAMRQVAATLDGMNITTPLIQYSKHQVIELGTQLGIDYAQTHSCMRDAHRHCGRCTQCLKRRTAFEAAGGSDPAIV